MNKLFISLDRIFPYLTIVVVVILLVFSLSNNTINTSINDYLSQTGTAKYERDLSKLIVKRVVDGDTVEFENGVKSRLLYIDTPETVKPNTPVQCYGKEASTKLNNLLLNKEVFITSDKNKEDRYGRSLNFIYLEESDAKSQNISKSINAYMVKNGYARSVSYSPNTTYKEDFNSWMQDAIDNKLGVWKNCPKPFEK